MTDLELQDILSQNICIDSPSKQDYPFDDYLEILSQRTEAPLTMKRPYAEWTAFAQGRIWACTFFWPTLANNWQQINEYKTQDLNYAQVDPMTLWNQQAVHTYQILDWVNFLKNKGMIQGFAVIPRCWQADNQHRVDKFKKAIDLGNYMITWARWYDYGRAYQFPMDTLKFTSTGFYATAQHCFNLVDYDDSRRVFVMAGSFGLDWWHNWYAYISYDDVWQLFSGYALINKDDSWDFAKLKNQQQAKQLIDSCSAFYPKELDSETQNLLHLLAQKLRSEYTIQ